MEVKKDAQIMCLLEIVFCCDNSLIIDYIYG